MRSTLVASHIQRRLFSKEAMVNPSKFVAGVTSDEIAQNEEIANFFAANFSDDNDEGRGHEATAEVSESEFQDGSMAVEESDLNIRKLHCFLRDLEEEEGSNRCRKLRAKHMIPGILYGGDPTQGILSKDPSSKTLIKTPWKLLHREMDLFHRSVESLVYDLTLFEHEDDEEGTVHRVIPSDIQRHPVKNAIFCANYLRYFPGRPINIPIVYINEEESPVLKRGGFIAPVSRYVNCIIEDGIPIPTKLELECTGLRKKDVVRMDRIIFPEGVKPSKRVNIENFLVGTVFGSRGVQEDDPAE